MINHYYRVIIRPFAEEFPRRRGLCDASLGAAADRAPLEGTGAAAAGIRHGQDTTMAPPGVEEGMPKPT